MPGVRPDQFDEADDGTGDQGVERAEEHDREPRAGPLKEGVIVQSDHSHGIGHERHCQTDRDLKRKGTTASDAGEIEGDQKQRNCRQ